MKIYFPKPNPNLKAELSKEDVAKLVNELRYFGFGRTQRTPEKARAYPLLDELTFLLEEYSDEPNETKR